MEAMGREKAKHTLELAQDHSANLTLMEDPDDSQSAICLGLAAADLLDIYQEPHFNQSTEGIAATLYTARIQTRLRTTYHPYIQACHHLETAAMLSIAGDANLTERWFNERKIATSIPAGHLSDECDHAFYQLVHLTIHELTGFGRDDIPPPSVINQQMKNIVRTHTGPIQRPIAYDHLYKLLGLSLWAKTLHHQRREPDLQTTNHGMTALNNAINGIYITPSLSWVRTAYAAINTQHQNTANKYQAAES